MEVTLGQVFHRRHGFLVPQQALRTHHDQRLAEIAHHLAAKQMIDLRRRRRHADLHVVLRAQLQVALGPRRRMLRTLPLIAMRQQQREPADAPPLDLAGGDELVDHDLRAIGEIAELRFPDHQLVGLRRRIAVFEPHDRRLRQHRIDDVEIGLAGADVLQRYPRARSPISRDSGRAGRRDGARTCRARSPARTGARRSPGR